SPVSSRGTACAGSATSRRKKARVRTAASIDQADRKRGDALLHFSAAGRRRGIQLEVVVEQTQLRVVAQAVPEVARPGQRCAGPGALARSGAGIAVEVAVGEARRQLPFPDEEGVADAQLGTAVGLLREQQALAQEIVLRVMPAGEHREAIGETVTEREVSHRG